MPRLKYKFNPSTLNFEKISYGIRDYTLSALRYLFAGLVIGAIGVVLYASFFKDPETARLSREVKFLKGQIAELNDQIDTLELFVTDLQEKDDNVYRSIFGAEPYPEHLRKGGVGGSDRYRDLRGFVNSEDIIETQKRINRLQRALVSQSKSFEEVYELAKSKDTMLKCIPAIQPVSNKELKRMASGFGYRTDPIYKTTKFHAGMDFAASVGTEIYATGDGVVLRADADASGYGNHVRINHGYGYMTLYGHMSKINVRPGQRVKRGDVIGYVGNTGKSVGPHLHYEVHKNGQTLNPVNFYYNDLSPEDYARMIEMSATENQAFD